jgi:CO/xanthine dehydrogenase Mo-binding subunit
LKYPLGDSIPYGGSGVEYDKILGDLLGRDEYLVVGRSMVRADALDKCLGRARFTADYIPNGTLVVKVLRSTKPHALLRRVDASAALELPGVEAVLTGADVPGENQIGYALPDQPLLNDVKVHYVGDPIALVCAKGEDAAQEALDAMQVEYEPLPTVLDVDAALAEGAPVIHKENNVAVTTQIRKGDTVKGFRKAKVVVEDTYWSPYQEHMALEPEAAYAVPEGAGKVTVIACMQSPHLVREKVAHVLGWGLNSVRIIQVLTGGAFGKKDDTGPLISAYAALAAVKTGKPAAIVYDRGEVMTSTPKRFPARFKYRSGADGNGKITAVEVDITLECGAYANRAPFWLWRQTAHACGPYEVPNVSVDGRAVYTNKVYGGSFRGFGNLALHFAAEQQVDKLAYELGIDPVDFRLRNILREGSHTTCDQVLDSSVGLEECLRGVAEASEWAKHREPVREGNRVRGWGVGCAYHGNSTSRSTPDWSAASLMLHEDGTLTYRTAICELGQGSPFGHAKIVAEIVGADMASIKIEQPDTDSTPDSKPTHGSRGLMMGGTAAADAAIKLRERMVRVAADMLGCPQKQVELRDSAAYNKRKPHVKIPFKELAEEMHARGESPGSYGFYASPKRFFDPETGLGVNYSVYTFAATVAEVEVDLETGQAEVVKVWPAMDVGKAIDPLMVEGQIQGAVSQGIGFALMENLQLRDGVVLNPGFKDYVVPSAMDTPEVDDTIIVESAYRYGAFGAKGVGEPAIISVVPAVVNAIHHATGLRFSAIPVTPDRLHRALKEARG